jgi:hypothetical protein
MAASKLSRQETENRTKIDLKNMIGVGHGDLPEEDQRWIKVEMRRELEEVEATKMCDKLACYQRTRSDIVQMVDTVKATVSKLNSSSFIPEDLVHLVDVSVTSKYDVDLAQLMHALAEDMWHTLDSYKHDLDNGLSRQIRSVVKEIIGNTQGKRVTDVSSTFVPSMTSPHGVNGAATGGASPSQAAGLNIQ